MVPKLVDDERSDRPVGFRPQVIRRHGRGLTRKRPRLRGWNAMRPDAISLEKVMAFGVELTGERLGVFCSQLSLAVFVKEEPKWIRSTSFWKTQRAGMTPKRSSKKGGFRDGS